jgi:ankyrin repeat protein
MISSLESVRLLLENGADPSLSRFGGQPVLVAPSLYYDPSMTMINLLIDHGADVNAADSSHQTALHHAVSVGNLPLVERLIAAGADVDAMSDFGTALHVARNYGHTPIADALIRAGADETIPDPGTGPPTGSPTTGPLPSVPTITVP